MRSIYPARWFDAKCRRPRDLDGLPLDEGPDSGLQHRAGREIDLGAEDARVASGSPERSTFTERMRSRAASSGAPRGAQAYDDTRS